MQVDREFARFIADVYASGALRAGHSQVKFYGKAASFSDRVSKLLVSGLPFFARRIFAHCIAIIEK